MATIVQHPAFAQPAPQTKDLPIADSSFIQNFQYDPTTLQLTVTMKTGAQYIHWFVYPAVFDQLMQAPSKGKFYASVIKGKHPSTRTISKSVGEAHPTENKTQRSKRHG